MSDRRNTPLSNDGDCSNELHVLMELWSSDLRIGAVNDAIDLAALARPLGVRFTFAGPLDEQFAAAAAKHGAVVLRASSRMFSRRGFPLYVLDVARWLERLARYRPDVVHLNYSGYGPSLACAARMCGIPIAGRASGAFIESNPSNRWVDTLLANCAPQAGELLASPLAPRVVVTGDLFRPARISGIDRRPIGRRAPRILFLGQLVERKGLHVLVEAFVRMVVDAELWIVGGDWNVGEYPARIRRAIDSLGIATRVTLLNHRDNVAELLQQADIFVLPSLSEARPRSILEAMLAELPVVASDVGGIPTVVDHETTGLLVPPAEAAALADALDRLAASEATRIQLGKAGRHYVEQECRLERTARKYVDIYRAMVEDARQAPRGLYGARPLSLPRLTR
jgi:glycosyltransferase involved in cell wall biosynthesis